MFLLVNPNGSKYFRLKYRIDGKEKTLALGVYPEATLKQARDDRDKARNKIAEGIDPCANKKAIKAAKCDLVANSFEVVSLEWFDRHMTDKSSTHKVRCIRILTKDMFPVIGNKPIVNVLHSDLLSALRKIEARGAVNTAHRALNVCSQVFRYAVVTGRCKSNITHDLKGALKQTTGGHFSAMTEPSQLAAYSD